RSSGSSKRTAAILFVASCESFALSASPTDNSFALSQRKRTPSRPERLSLFQACPGSLLFRHSVPKQFHPHTDKKRKQVMQKFFLHRDCPVYRLSENSLMLDGENFRLQVSVRADGSAAGVF